MGFSWEFEEKGMLDVTHLDAGAGFYYGPCPVSGLFVAASLTARSWRIRTGLWAWPVFLFGRSGPSGGQSAGTGSGSAPVGHQPGVFRGCGGAPTCTVVAVSTGVLPRSCWQ